MLTDRRKTESLYGAMPEAGATKIVLLNTVKKSVKGPVEIFFLVNQKFM